MNKYLVYKIIRYNTKLVYHETVEYLINTVAETPVDLYKNCFLSTMYSQRTDTSPYNPSLQA